MYGKGIKNFWRPVLDLIANATTNNAAYQTVLNLPATKRGKTRITIWGIELADFALRVTIDGNVIFTDLPIRGREDVVQCNVDFEKSLHVEQKADGANNVITYITYYYLED